MTSGHTNGDAGIATLGIDCLCELNEGPIAIQGVRLKMRVRSELHKIALYRSFKGEQEVQKPERHGVTHLPYWLLPGFN